MTDTKLGEYILHDLAGRLTIELKSHGYACAGNEWATLVLYKPRLKSIYHNHCDNRIHGTYIRG